MTEERDKQGTTKGAVTAPATSVKKGAPLDSYSPFASTDANAFRKKLSEDNPALGALLTTNKEDKVGRAKILAGMSRQSRQATFGMLISLTFQFKKRSQHDEALHLARINYEVAASDPADQVDSFLDHTQPRNVGDALSTIGRIQNEMGDYSQALSTCLEAEARYQDDETLRKQAGITKPSKMDLAFNLVDFRSENFALIAEIHKQLGDIKAAEEYIGKAWQFSKRGADPQSRFEEKISAANGAKARGDLNLALGGYLEALKLAFDLPTSAITGKDVVQPLSAMGMIYADLGLNRRALELFEQARRINERSSHLGRLLRDHANIAEVHAARGETESAMASYRRALVCASREITQSPSQSALIWRDGDKTYQLVQLESAWQLLLAMARLERTQHPDIALAQLELAVSVIEHLRTRVVQEERRVSYQAPSMEVYDELVDLLAQQYETTNDQTYVDKLFWTIERAKARVLYEMLADQPIAKPPGTPDELIGQETQLLQDIEELQKLLDGSEGSSFEKIDQLDAANDKLSQVWELIASSDPDEGPEYVSLRKAEVASCEDIRETLRASGQYRVAVANYYLAKKRLIVVCLYSDKPDLSYHSAPVDRDDVRNWALVKPAAPPRLDRRLPHWFAVFPPVTVAAIADAVADYDVVCVALHDVLHSLPFHAFPVGPNATPLIEHSTMSYVPSASILRFCLRRRKPNVGNSLIVGNPDRPDQVFIPGSEAEARNIATLLNCQAITGAAATRTTVVEKGTQAEYLHLACHCEFSREDPLNSALLLTGGNLTARDIFSWRLNPKLVVLSACESGVSKVQAGDELIGLVRALLFAGTPTVIVSLWNAYDDSAAEIMGAFYRAHLHEKKSMVSALADAQRSQYRHGVPAEQWAPFILVGDWR